MSKVNKIKARVLVDCTINGLDFACGSVIEGSAETLKPYLGEALDKSAAAVKYALEEGAETKQLQDVKSEEAEEETDSSATK